MKFAIVSVLAAGLGSIAIIGSVSAGDIQGDAYDCGELWTMRNQIYKQNGYCFKTTKAINQFGNADCSYDSLADVPMSKQDKIVIRDIKRSERRQGC